MENTKEKKDKISIKELKPFLKFYKKYWILFIPMCILMAIEIAIGIIAPIFAGRLIASFTTNFDYDLIIKLILIILFIEIVEQIVSIFTNITWNKLTINISKDISLDLIKRYNQIKISSYDQNGSFKMISRMNGDVSVITSLPWKLLHSITSIISKIGFITYCFVLSWEVGLVMVGTVLFTLIIRFYLIKVRAKRYDEMQKDSENEGNLRMENIRGIRDVRALNVTDNLYSKISDEAIRNARKRNKLINKNHIEQNVGNMLLSLLSSIAVFLLVLLVTRGRIDIATMIIAYNYRNNVANFAFNIVFFKEYMTDASLSAKRLNEFYDEKLYPLEQFGDVEISDINGEIEFKNVSFCYETENPVLNNLSFNVKPNTMVSIVGKSGSGKSTIISLLDKLYFLEDNQGEILLDGHNINNLTRSSLRDNITIVSQSPYLFNISVAENLRLAKPDATEKELNKALKQSEMYDCIMSKPDKLDSMLGENGIILSGGEKQRLAIARAILKGSKVIVFDEATSALDNENQAKIKHVISKLKKDHTIIMIAHRLSTVVDSDEIIYLENGKVKKHGTHDYLMKNCKEYKNLYKEENV